MPCRTKNDLIGFGTVFARANGVPDSTLTEVGKSSPLL